MNLQNLNIDLITQNVKSFFNTITQLKPDQLSKKLSKKENIFDESKNKLNGLKEENDTNSLNHKIDQIIQTLENIDNDTQKINVGTDVKERSFIDGFHKIDSIINEIKNIKGGKSEEEQNKINAIIQILNSEDLHKYFFSNIALSDYLSKGDLTESKLRDIQSLNPQQMNKIIMETHKNISKENELEVALQGFVDRENIVDSVPRTRDVDLSTANAHNKLLSNAEFIMNTMQNAHIELLNELNSRGAEVKQLIDSFSSLGLNVQNKIQDPSLFQPFNPRVLDNQLNALNMWRDDYTLRSNTIGENAQNNFSMHENLITNLKNANVNLNLELQKINSSLTGNQVNQSRRAEQIRKEIERNNANIEIAQANLNEERSKLLNMNLGNSQDIRQVHLGKIKTLQEHLGKNQSILRDLHALFQTVRRTITEANSKMVSIRLKHTLINQLKKNKIETTLERITSHGQQSGSGNIFEDSILEHLQEMKRNVFELEQMYERSKNSIINYRKKHQLHLDGTLVEDANPIFLRDKEDPFNFKRWERDLDQYERKLKEKELEIKEKQTCLTDPAQILGRKMRSRFHPRIIDRINNRINVFTTSLDMHEKALKEDFKRLSDGFIEQFERKKNNSNDTPYYREKVKNILGLSLDGSDDDDSDGDDSQMKRLDKLIKKEAEIARQKQKEDGKKTNEQSQQKKKKEEEEVIRKQREERTKFYLTKTFTSFVSDENVLSFLRGNHFLRDNFDNQFNQLFETEIDKYINHAKEVNNPFKHVGSYFYQTKSSLLQKIKEQAQISEGFSVSHFMQYLIYQKTNYGHNLDQIKNKINAVKDKLNTEVHKLTNVSLLKLSNKIDINSDFGILKSLMRYISETDNDNNLKILDKFKIKLENDEKPALLTGLNAYNNKILNNVEFTNFKSALNKVIDKLFETVKTNLQSFLNKTYPITIPIKITHEILVNSLSNNDTVKEDDLMFLHRHDYFNDMGFENEESKILRFVLLMILFGADDKFFDNSPEHIKNAYTFIRSIRSISDTTFQEKIENAITHLKKNPFDNPFNKTFTNTSTSTSTSTSTNVEEYNFDYLIKQIEGSKAGNQYNDFKKSLEAYQKSENDKLSKTIRNYLTDFLKELITDFFDREFKVENLIQAAPANITNITQQLDTYLDKQFRNIQDPLQREKTSEEKASKVSNYFLEESLKRERRYLEIEQQRNESVRQQFLEEIERRQKEENLSNNAFKYNIKREQVFHEYYKATIRLIRESIASYEKKHFDFLAKIMRGRKKYLNRWRNNDELKVHLKPYETEIEKIDKQMMDLSERAKKFLLIEVANLFDLQIAKFNLMNVIDPEERLKYIDDANRVRHKLDESYVRIFNYYNYDIKWKYILLDPQFLLIYGLKIVNAVVFFIILYTVSNRFLLHYQRKVYERSGQPPSLMILPLIAFILHFVYNLILVITLFVLEYLYKTSTNTFIVDKYVIQNYLTDMASVYVFVISLSFLTGLVIQKRHYFRYSTEGARAIRIQKQVMFALMGIFSMIPFFYHLT